MFIYCFCVILLIMYYIFRGNMEASEAKCDNSDCIKTELTYFDSEATIFFQENFDKVYLEIYIDL